ncbi:MAG TPA: DJ-1/PfpI family protein [Baekduia sp.]|uniref:DJ-1/PfpI family protein n=1 Tax=Baekduia sp. TaxID=2600305 RepID=UPI002BB2E809|nr:DJ-1/PfpI family protein [Baekduia sp.]HMJ35735.1 DJ-1/PfpI family protein [Baekduia sp.]
MLDIVIPIYDDFTALDAIGPYEVLSRVGGRVRFVGTEPGPVRTDNGMLQVIAEASLADAAAPDVVVVPGGVGTRALTTDPVWLEWLRGVHATSTWTTSVCTGSLLLGAAGILDGLRATSHWLELETLREYGAEPTGQRVVEQGKVITAAGVSAGIDMALTLAARLVGEDAAKAIQLGIEYDPQPPFDSGSVQKSDPAAVAAIRAAVAAREQASRDRAGA